MFDFVIGFAGSSTLPTQIRNAFGQLIERIGVDKTAGIWDTIIRVIGHDLHLLQVNLVIAVYKEHGQDGVVARKIGCHTLPMHLWGVEFDSCGMPGCQPSPLDFFIQNSRYDVRMTCRLCHWQSAWVKEDAWKHHIFRMDTTLPNIFWHSYPPLNSLRNIFVDVTAQSRRA